VSNDPQAPFPGPESGDGSADAPSAPDYAAPQPSAPDYAAPQPSAPDYAAPQPSAPGYAAPQNAPQYGTPPPPPPPTQPAGGYPPPPLTSGYAPAPGMGPGAVVGQPADLMTRFLARLIDYVILAVVGMVVVTVIVVGAIMGDSAGFGGFGATNFAAGAVSSVITAVIYVGYFAFMESSRGQTIGKMAMKLKVLGPDGRNPTMAEAVKRNAWTGLGILGIVPFIGGPIGGLLQLAAVIYIAVTINNNVATRQGWHDEFAGGTKVIRIG
jgi:uncharacterized RDD family membrane protein YckC